MRVWAWGVWIVILFCLGGCQRSSLLDSVPATQSVSLVAWTPELPADVIFVIDQSGSMSRGKAATDPDGVRTQGAREYLDFWASRAELGSDVRIGIVNFGSDAPQAWVAPLTPLRALNDSASERLKAVLRPLDLGETNFASALRAAVQLFVDASSFDRPRRRVIVLFTDGEPRDTRRWTAERYFNEIRQIYLEHIQARQIELFVLGINNTATPEWSRTVGAWQAIAGSENVFTLKSLDELRSRFIQIAQRIGDLPESPSEILEDGQRRSIEVGPYLAALEFYIYPSRGGASLKVTRPDGTVVKPGADSDAPAVQRGSSFYRLSVLNPSPGTWQYEASGGRVEVVHNALPLRADLLTPVRIHPAGKPLHLILEFKRADGRPVASDRHHPLGLSADIITAEGKRHQVLFNPSPHTEGVYEGQSEITDTLKTGEYTIIVKVQGGDKFRYRQTVKIQVAPVPYLLIEVPSSTKSVEATKTISVRVRLYKEQRPYNPREFFTNHPDRLVMATIHNQANTAGETVWLRNAPNDPTCFLGEVPMPSTEPGAYTLKVKLAPEDALLQDTADLTQRRFTTHRSWWYNPIVWVGIVVVMIGAAILWRVWITAPLLSVYYRTPEMRSHAIVASRKRNELLKIASLLEVRRDGKQPQIVVRPRSGNRFIPEREYIVIRQGSGQVLTVESSGREYRIVVSVGAEPPPIESRSAETPSELSASPNEAGDYDEKSYEWNIH